MGTQYRVVNLTKKEIYGFGLDWNPKYREAIINRTPARFLLFLMLEARRGDDLKVISEGNSWDWEYELSLKGFEDKTKEFQERFIDWDKEDNEVRQ